MNKNTYVIIGLFLALIIIFFQIRDLKTTLNENTMSVQNSSQQLQNEMEMLQQEIHSLKAGQQWVNTEEFKKSSKESTNNTLYLDLNWSFREIDQEAKVSVKYRERGGEWKTAEASITGGTSYQATLELEPDKEYEYQILSEGATLKSNDIKSIPFEKYRHFPLHTERLEIGRDHNNHIVNADLRFVQFQKPLFDSFEVDQIYLYLYSNDKKERVEVEEAKETYEKETDMGGKVWHYRSDLKDKEIERIDLEVTYQNGCVQKETVEGFMDEETMYEEEIYEEPMEQIQCS